MGKGKEGIHWEMQHFQHRPVFPVSPGSGGQKGGRVLHLWISCISLKTLELKVFTLIRWAFQAEEDTPKCHFPGRLDGIILFQDLATQRWISLRTQLCLFTIRDLVHPRLYPSISPHFQPVPSHS